MTKYNKSEIMRRAWEIRRSYYSRSLTFGECLKRAWAEAKMAVENAKAYAIKKFENGMEITVDGYTRTLSRWTKGGHDRVYINGGSRKGDGYVDLVRKEANLYNSCKYNVKMAEIILAMEF